MDETQTPNTSSAVGRAIKLPLQGAWFLVRHPVLSLLLALLVIFSSFSFLAHFNPAVATHFSNAAAYFGASVLASEVPDLKKEIRSLNARIAHKDAEIKGKSRALKEQNQRMARFRERGVRFKKASATRFKKIAMYDTSGELIGWIPVIGDLASIGLAAGGIYEMCQMFKEIEAATEELGATYQVYTDSFCEKAVDKSKTHIAQKAAKLKGEVVAMTTVLTDRTVSTSKSSMNSLVTKAQSWLDQAYELFRELYEYM